MVLLFRMNKPQLLATLLLIWPCITSHAQITRTSIPMGEAVNKALAKGALTTSGARPFHIKVVVSEPENPQSPYQGTIEEWWESSDQWRREISSKDGMHQMIIVSGGKKTEQDEGEYFPLWLRRFVTAVFDPIPNASAWTKSSLMITQVTMPNGDKSDACARATSKIGTGERATDAFSNICFDGEGRLKFFGSPGYDMEFHDYSKFGKKQIARKLIDSPEPGTTLVGQVIDLEELSKAKVSSELFVPLKANEDRFRSVQVSSETLEKLTEGNAPIVWPAVHSGNIRGRLAVYIATDEEGQVREAWPLNSDNAGLEDPLREQIRHWKIKPATDSTGKRVQVDGALGFSFKTKIEEPLPQLSDAEVRQLAINLVEPVWPAGVLKAGDVVEVNISVNEKGELTGYGFSKVPTSAQSAVMNATPQWKFRPLVRNGKPQYFHGTVRFTIR